MPPNVDGQSCPDLTTSDSPESVALKSRKLSDPEVKDEVKARPEDSFQINRVRWGNFIGIAIGHAIAIYGFIVFPYLQCWRTFIWCMFTLNYIYYIKIKRQVFLKNKRLFLI